MQHAAAVMLIKHQPPLWFPSKNKMFTVLTTLSYGTEYSSLQTIDPAGGVWVQN